MKNTYLEFILIFKSFKFIFISSGKAPPLIGTIGANVTIKNCSFTNILVFDNLTLFQFTDKGSYYINLPYVEGIIYGIFEDLIIEALVTPMIPSHTLPLIIYGTHSEKYPMYYQFKNCSFTLNKASIF